MLGNSKYFLEDFQMLFSANEVIRGSGKYYFRTEKLTAQLNGRVFPETIIRLADWFGISAVVCSQATADVFSPKVVQATMGSLARVDVCQDVDLPAFLSSLQSTVPVYGTFLDGDNIYSSHLSPFGVIVMGNEGKGISDAVARCVNRRITIPNFNGADKGADSLNVAVATAVVCSEFRRMSAT